MLSHVLGGLTLIRHAVAITLVVSAAGATVASAVDYQQSTARTSVVAQTGSAPKTEDRSNLEAAVKACLATKDPASDDCAKAVDLSGLSEADFWAKVALSLNEQLGRAKNEKHEPSAEPSAKPQNVNTRELMALVAACVASHERSSEPCAKALQLSGLPPDEFWAKVGAMFDGRKNDEPTSSPKAKETKPSGTPRTEPKPSAKPQPTQSVSDATLAAMVRDCFAKYETASASKGNEALGHAAYEACTKAIAASGLSADAFWEKFGHPVPAAN